jgi:hypothetical protein
LSKNRHDELALGIIVACIGLFQFIEHLVNFNLSGTLRAHFRYFMFKGYQHGLDNLEQLIAIHGSDPLAALIVNALDEPGSGRKRGVSKKFAPAI